MKDVPPLVEEFHYADGDVGSHPASELGQLLWKHFSPRPGHHPVRIVIRRAEPDETKE